jgi:hypothetical protein
MIGSLGGGYVGAWRVCGSCGDEQSLLAITATWESEARVSRPDQDSGVLVACSSLPLGVLCFHDAESSLIHDLAELSRCARRQELAGMMSQAAVMIAAGFRGRLR